jgi:hypothetical protein
VESAPRAYRLKAGNAASPISTFSGAIPRTDVRIGIGSNDLSASYHLIVIGLRAAVQMVGPVDYLIVVRGGQDRGCREDGECEDGDEYLHNTSP